MSEVNPSVAEIPDIDQYREIGFMYMRTQKTRMH